MKHTYRCLFIAGVLGALSIQVQAFTDELKSGPDGTAEGAPDIPANYGSITGLVVDALSKEPIPYVNVVVRNQNDSLITGGITDDKGTFHIKDLPEGANKVEIQFIGYEKVVTEVEVSRMKSRHELSTIALTESTQLLEEVEVRAELSSVTQKIDRKVINVGKDLTATGTSASELLNNVQSVSVDPQSGSISLRGNENVKILVDGRPTNVSAAQLLQQIPSSSIKSIELITNPSAKYNPEGMSGIINIVLYKNATLGLNGSVNGGLTYGRNLSYNGALDVNYRKGKVNFFANYGGNARNSEGGGSVERFDTDLDQEMVNSRTSGSHLFKGGADIYMNERNTLSVYTTQNLYRGLSGRSTSIYLNEMLDSENPNELESGNYTGTYNLNYKRDFEKKGHDLVLDISHATSDKYSEGLYEELVDPSDLVNNYTDATEDDISTTVANLDYTNPLTDNIKLELGLEARMRDVENSYTTDRHQYVYDGDGNPIPDGEGGFLTTPMGSSNFSYDRDIFSAYANYGHQLGNFTLQAGVRLEQYEVNAVFAQEGVEEPYQDSRFTAYPSAFLTYALGEKNQFQASYSRRVDRPSVTQVNPIRSSWSSPLLVFVGNPELTPQFTDSYELNYSRRLGKGSLSFGVFFRQIHDNISRYTELDPLDPNKVYITYVNADGENRYGFEASGMYRPTKWWSINASFDTYYQLISGIAFGNYVEVDNFSTNVRMNNTFKVGDKLSLQLFGLYRGARSAVQYDFKPMAMVNAGASYKVFNDQGTVSVRVNDIFKTMSFGFESNGNWYPSVGEFFWESRSVNVSYTHRFGKGNNKARRLKARDSREMSGGEGGF